MFVNQQTEFNFSGRLENEISDHQAVVVNTKLILPHTKTRYITIYSNGEEAKNNFKNDISSKNIFKKFGAMHFIYYIKRSIATKVDSTYLGY